MEILKMYIIIKCAGTISLLPYINKRLLPTTKRVGSMPTDAAMQKGLVAIKGVKEAKLPWKIVREDNVYRARAIDSAGLLSLGRRCCREDPLSSVACAQAVPQMTHAKVNYTLKGFNIMKRSICMRGRPAALPHHDTTVLRVSLRATDVSWVRWAQIERSYEPNNGARSHADGLKKKRRV